MGALWPMAALALQLGVFSASTATSTSTGATPPMFDFWQFEVELMGKWVASMRSGEGGPGEYSWLPARLRKPGQSTSIYGTTDVAYAMFATGQLSELSLSELSLADRVAWATIINGFQNASTGWYDPAPWEVQNEASFFFFFFLTPWHPTGPALEALDLLDCGPACVGHCTPASTKPTVEPTGTCT